MKWLVALLMCAPAAAQTMLNACSGYANSATLQLTPSGTSTTLTNYPAPVYGTYTFLATTANGGGVASSSGFDIQFSDSANSVCYSYYRASYNGATGAVLFYVNLPSLPSSGLTLKVWYGKPNDVDHSSASAWNSNYYQVHPLQESSDPYLDVSPNAQNSIGGTYPSLTTGLLGNAQQFTASSSQYIVFPGFVQSGTIATVEALVNPTANGSNNLAISDERNTSNCSMGTILPFIAGNTGFAGCYVDSFGGFPLITGSTDLRGAWHHIACSTLAGNNFALYVDGATVATGSGFASNGATASAGRACGSPAGYFNGKMQDLRFMKNQANNADWIKTDAYSALNPTTFATITNPTSLPVVSSFSCPASAGQGATVTCSYTVSNSATSVTLSGACPWSFSGCVYNGNTSSDSHAFEVEFNTSFRVTACNANGCAPTVYQYVTVTQPGASGANPTLSNVSVSGISSTEVLMQATSNTPAQWQMKCSTAPSQGGTVISTPVLWRLAAGPAPFGYAVTQASIAVTGLTPSTTYYCQAWATNDHGGPTKSADQQITTPATEATTPVRATFHGTYWRLNDLYNGAYGATNRGYGDDGDTRYCGWDDTGQNLCTYQDGWGINASYGPAGIGIERAPKDYRQVSTVGSGALLAPNSGYGPFSENGMHCIRGVCYLFTFAGYSVSAASPSIIRSTDHWRHSLAARNGGANGPNVAQNSGLDSPPAVSVTISGSSWSGGTITLTHSAWGSIPVANGEVYISGSTGGNCDGLHYISAATSTTTSYASSNVSCTAGTIQWLWTQVSGCGSGTNPNICIGSGSQGIFWWFVPATNFCQDYSQNCTFRSNNSGWLFGNCFYAGLCAMRVEDIFTEDYTRLYVYKGTQGTSDVIGDPASSSAWGLATANTATTLSGAPYSDAALSAQKDIMVFEPSFNRWMLYASLGGNQSSPPNASVWDLGQYPNGNPVYAGMAVLDPVNYPGISPGFPNPLYSMAQIISSSPLVKDIPLIVSGGDFKGPNRAMGSTDSYSVQQIQMRLIDGTAPDNPRSAVFGPQAWVADHTRVLYRFQPNPLNLINDAEALLAGVSGCTPGQSGCFSVRNSVTTYPNWDQFGMLLAVPGGNDDAVNGFSWDNTNAYVGSINSGYSEAFGVNFTTEFCFGHYPYQFTPPGQSHVTVLGGAAGEIALAGGDVTIVRNGTTYGAGASWTFTVRGTGLGSIGLADGTFGCFAVRVNGTAAQVFKSSDVPLAWNGAPLIPTLTGTVSGTSTAGTVAFGGATSLRGSVFLFKNANTNYTDQQLWQDMRANGIYALSLDPVNKTAQVAGH